MTAPVLGIPAGMKQTGQRVDFRPGQFDLVIETKGYLLAWTRSSICPCSNPVDQSQQPDPNCSLCDGQGWIYFGGEAQDLSDYTFTTLQQSILTDTDAMVIRGIITNITNKQDQLNDVSNWVDGTMRLTVRPENKLGYLDRVVGLDVLIVYSEHIKADGTATMIPRYPIVEVNQIRSESTVYVEDTDYEINDVGNIIWMLTPPVVDTLLSVHYHCHPTWLITDHPHSARMTTQMYKTPTPITPTGDPRDLPTQAMVLYEFLYGN